jgi:hypothetical protein
MSTISEDFAFARGCEEFQVGFKDGCSNAGRLCPMLRYIVALNPSMTKKEFIAAAVIEGIKPTTAAIQFANSRRVSASMDAIVDKDGRITNA